MLDLNRLVRTHIGVTIARLRGARGWRLGDLAEASGLDTGYLRDVEAGEVLLDETARERVAGVLGVDPDSFYDGFFDSLRTGLWPAATNIGGRA